MAALCDFCIKITNMDLQSGIIITLIGIAAGLLSGLLGLGGAIIIIPALVMLLGFSQQTAQGTTLLMMVLPVGGLAAFQYYKNGMVDMKAAGILALTFFISAFFGARLASHVPQLLLKRAFALMLIGIAAKILFFEKN